MKLAKQGGLFLHPVDMAMFGYLYLKNGQLKSSQIVSEEWVRTSLSKHTSVDNIHESINGKWGYGYLWWILPVDATVGTSLRLNEFYCALGYGGQCIFIIPPLDMVVVSTAENFDNIASMFSGFNFLLDYILPAVKEK
jgi:CubicO group peptidase (beta-lactamase class C family)